MTQLDLEVLLRHRAFLENLARGLVRDEHLAEDVTQQTYLQAVRFPPTRNGVRAWLGRVAFNIARNLERRATRRSARERAVAREEAIPSAAEVVEREALRREVITAVMKLSESYRTVILLRYYEGLSPAAIARRLRTAGGTVRARLHRAHELLRQELDRAHGGDRDAWLSALAKLAWPTARSSLATVKVALVLVVVIGLGSLHWFFGFESSPPTGPGSGAELVAPVSALEDATDEAESAPGHGLRRWSPNRTAIAATHTYPGDRVASALDVVLLDDIGGKPWASRAVEVRSSRGLLPPRMELADDREIAFRAVTDPEGRLRCPGLPSGTYEISLDLENGWTARAHCDVAPSLGHAPDEIVLRRHKDSEKSWLWFRVVGGDGEGVADADVEVLGGSDTVGEEQLLGPLRTRSDADGFCSIRGERPEMGLVRASAPDGRVGLMSFQTTFGPSLFEIVVGMGGRVSGELEGAASGELAGAKVQALATRFGFACAYDGVIAGNRYSVENLPAGSYVLDVRCPSGLRLDLEPRKRGSGEAIPDTLAPVRIDIREGRSTQRDLAVVRGALLQGAVANHQGRPVAGATVTVALREETGNTWSSSYLCRGKPVFVMDAYEKHKPGMPTTTWHTITDGAGRYRVAGLPDAALRVEVTAPGLSWDYRSGVRVHRDRPTRIAHVLEPAGVLECVGEPGYVARGDIIAVVRRGESVPSMQCWLGPYFALPGLPAGDYQVVRTDPRGRRSTFLASARVCAGRTTRVDLRARSGAAITGQLVNLPGSGPLPVVFHRGFRVRVRLTGDFEVRTSPWFAAANGFQLEVIYEGGCTCFVVPTPQAGRLPLGPHALDVIADRSAVSVVAKSKKRQLDAGGARVKWSTTVADLRPEGRGRVRSLYAGTYDLRVEYADGSTSLHQDVEVPSASPVRLERPACGTLVVTVEDTQGRPMPRTRVRVRAEHKLVFGVTNRAGTTRFPGLPAGEVGVELRPGTVSRDERVPAVVSARARVRKGDVCRLRLIYR